MADAPHDGVVPPPAGGAGREVPVAGRESGLRRPVVASGSWQRICYDARAVVQLLLRITAAPGQTGELLQALRSVMRGVMAGGECVAAHLLTDVDDGEVVWYWEDWPGRGAFERHLRSDGFARLISLIETSSTLPLLECRFVSESRGLEYLAAVRGVDVAEADAGPLD